MEATSAVRPHGLRLSKPRRVLAAFSDERLVDQVRAGDDVAFEVLFDRHHRPVLAFCRHMLGSADEAEDAVQHAFIAAYNDLHRGGAERDIRFKAWLYTIARNRCLSILRARREQASDEIELTTDRLSDDVQNRADLQALVADLRDLPQDQREALVLSEVGDLSHIEVARIIGCEAGKVKSLVFQARTALIERRDGRDTPCSEIREQLATLRGGALRRSPLRHHLKSCPACTQYRDEIRRQRQMLALALPVVPSLGLRSQVLAAVGAGGGAGGAGIGGGISVLAKGGLAKFGVAAVVAAGAAAGTIVATHTSLQLGHHSGGSTHSGATPANAASATGAAGALSQGARGKSHAGAAGATADHTRSAAGTAHGFTPVRGQSNGAAARQFALTRGLGKHLGITKTHHHAARTRTHHPAVPPRRGRLDSHSAPRRTTTTTTPPPTAKPEPKTDSSAPTQTTESTTPAVPPPPTGGGNGKAIGRLTLGK